MCWYSKKSLQIIALGEVYFSSVLLNNKLVEINNYKLQELHHLHSEFSLFIFSSLIMIFSYLHPLICLYRLLFYCRVKPDRHFMAPHCRRPKPKPINE